MDSRMVMAKEIISKSIKDTSKLAQQLTKKLRGGEIVALYGDLGSGKTTFVQCLAKELGIKEKVQSPTFMLVKSYNINSKVKAQKSKPQLKIQNLVHADLYRIKSAHEVKEIGLVEYFGKKDTLVFIEWPEAIEKLLPKNAIKIKFEHCNNEFERKITILG